MNYLWEAEDRTWRRTVVGARSAAATKAVAAVVARDRELREKRERRRRKNLPPVQVSISRANQTIVTESCRLL
jgi:hypothetical protein